MGADQLVAYNACDTMGCFSSPFSWYQVLFYLLIFGICNLIPLLHFHRLSVFRILNIWLICCFFFITHCYFFLQPDFALCYFLSVVIGFILIYFAQPSRSDAYYSFGVETISGLPFCFISF